MMMMKKKKKKKKKMMMMMMMMMMMHCLRDKLVATNSVCSSRTSVVYHLHSPAFSVEIHYFFGPAGCKNGAVIAVSRREISLQAVVYCLFFSGARSTKLSDARQVSPASLNIVILVDILPGTWGRYHGGRRPSSDDSFHSPTVIPPSALDRPSILKRYYSRRTCSHTSPRRSPMMVTLHDTQLVECRWWNDGWTVKTVVT